MKTSWQRALQSGSWSVGVWRPACLLAACVAAGACGGSGAGVACDTHMGTVHVCWDYAGGDMAETEAAGSCTVDPGTVVGSCPTANLLGSCAVPSNAGVKTTLFFYSDAGETADLAQNECIQNQGTWTAGS